MSRVDSALGPDVAAIGHILRSPRIVGRTSGYVGADGVDWSGLLDEATRMSGGERLLVEIAYDLHEAGRSIGVWELARRLDRASFERVLEALRIARGELAPPAHQLRHVA